MKNLPFDPLEALARTRAFKYLDPACLPELTLPTVSDVTAGMIAEVLGVDRKTISYWRKNGVGQWKADKACKAIGLTPWDVWGHAWMEGVDIGSPAA